MMNGFWTRYFRNANFMADDGAGAGAGAGGGGAGGGDAAAAAAAAAAAKGGAGGGAGGAGDPWYQPHVANLDKDTLAWLDGAKFPDPVSALKSGANAAKLARERNVIVRPDPQKINDWEGWKDLGWNPDPAAYAKAITPPKMPEGQQHDAELFGAFTKSAHELKVLPAQAQKLYDGMTEAINQRVAAFKAKGAADEKALETTLRGDWGIDYDNKREIAKRTMAAIGLGADDSAKLEAAMGSPGLVKKMAEFGAKLGEQGLVTNTGGSGGMAPGAAAAELRRLEGDPAWMAVFTNPNNPLSADYAAQRMKLIEAIAKGTKAA